MYARLVLLPLAAALALAAPAASKPAIKDHVTLRLQLFGQDPPCFSFGGFHRVLPDGTVETAPFTVPKGRVLVVTDYVWSAVERAPFSPPRAGESLRASLSSYSAPATNESLVYQSEPVDVTQENVLGSPGTHSRLVTGAVVGSERLLCPFLQSVGVSGAAVTVSMESALVYGYLAKAR